VDAGEQCDDGNVTPADGCSAQCTQENPDTCPGPTIPLTTAGFVVMGDTTGAANDAGALPCGGAYTGDLVYEIFPSQDGTLTATLNGSFQTLLYARSACPGTANETIACSAMTTPATITMQVTAGKSYFVFVDGYGLAAEEGPFTLMLELN
jgi:cysteine-rich repeat protein